MPRYKIMSKKNADAPPTRQQNIALVFLCADLQRGVGEYF